ncbi:hypothetical protein BBO_01289 [Beauveria brongniartii RCEF 3172]|uniref:Uncharacterized protein n=1 Tax=Beauveria brongniartii RCEF 3172 TaxID=1081107 RepID=A0A167K7V2_9HYPO|nr:hypothetical protein BBO_01289 [Beauveria brongniartii RCEF 3172]
MLSLSLLLSAAAGVNALVGGTPVLENNADLGGHQEPIQISDTQFICPGDCAFQGVFFGRPGHFCPEAEAVVRLDEDGKLDDERYGTVFQCPEERLADGITTRKPYNREKPSGCYVGKIRNPNPISCSSNREGKSAEKTVKWSDIAKELKSKTEKRRTQGGRNKCGKAAQEVYSQCTKTGESQECEEESKAFMESCLSAE